MKDKVNLSCQNSHVLGEMILTRMLPKMQIGIAFSGGNTMEVQESRLATRSDNRQGLGMMAMYSQCCSSKPNRR